MLNRYFHTLQYKQPGALGPAKRNDDGDWVKPAASTVDVTVECRAEPNGSGRKVSSQDGSEVVYSWTVYAGPETAIIPFGTKLQLFKDGVKFGEGTLKLFSAATLNVKIYV